MSVCCFFRVQDHSSLFSGYFNDAPAKEQWIPATSPRLTSPSLTSNTDSEAVTAVGNEDAPNERFNTPDRAYSVNDDEDMLNKIVSPIPQY